MKKYKIVSSTNPAFLNIEIPFDFDGKNIGDMVNILNEELKITQTGTVYQCVSNKTVMTFQEIIEEIDNIDDIEDDLIINV